MATLRQRGSSSALTGSHHRELRALAEEENRDPPVLQQSFRSTPPSSGVCAYACLAFSVTAVIFLSSIANMLDSNSVYIRVNVSSSSTFTSKRDLAKGVRYAAGLYVICGLFSMGLVCLQRYMHDPHLTRGGRFGYAFGQGHGHGQNNDVHGIEYEDEEGVGLVDKE